MFLFILFILRIKRFQHIFCDMGYLMFIAIFIIHVLKIIFTAFWMIL